MPTPLTPDLIDTSLAALTDWTGDTTSISRTIRLDSPEQVDDLIGSVDESARSLQHPPVVESEGSAVTFTLSTAEIGGVSEVDITLAARIDNLAGQLAGAPPTPAPSTAIVDHDSTTVVDQGPPRG